jgi:hypothetical protein
VGANPVDRGKPRSKLHLVCDGNGLLLTVVVTAANVTDTTVFQAILDDLPPARTPSGRRRTRPGAVHADKAYDSRANRSYLRRRAIRPHIARRGIESSTRLGAVGGRSSGRLPGLAAGGGWRCGVERDSERWVCVGAAGVRAGLLEPPGGS